MIAVDLDGDGDLDLLSASRIQDRVVWYENLMIEDDVADSTVLTPSPLSITDPTPIPMTASSSLIDETGKMQPKRPIQFRESTRPCSS